MKLSSSSLPSSSISLFDSHCHFDFDVFGDVGERERLWENCQLAGVQQLLVPGVEPEQWDLSYTLTESLSGLVMSAGVHPWWVKKLNGNILDSAQLKQLEQCLSRDKCVAVGECGLDASIELGLDKQQAIFEQQIQLACHLGLPLVIHVRKTHNETLKLLSHYRPKAGGVIHGFTGSIDLARRYWKLGFYLGIGGSITYPRANKTRETVKLMPLQSLLLETDAPDMPLKGFQGEPNSPLKLRGVAHALADLRGDTLETVCHTTTENSRRLFML